MANEGDPSDSRPKFLDWIAGWDVWQHICQGGAAALGVGSGAFVYELGAGLLYPEDEKIRYKLTTAALVGAVVYFCALITCQWWRERRAQPKAPAPTPPAALAAVTPKPSTTRPTSFVARDNEALIDASLDELERQLIEFPGPVPGWPHFLDDRGRSQAEPSLLSTAYAIRALLVRPRGDRYSITARATETLLESQLDGGGWAAGAQKDLPRPEVTGPILIAARHAGDANDERFQTALTRFLTIVDDPSYPSPWDLTFLSTVAITTLCAVAPEDNLLPRLRDRLVNGFVDRPGDGGGWGAELQSERQRIPTVAHTARAVSALSLVARRNLDTARSRLMVDEGVAFLLESRTTDDYTETLTRQSDGREMETLAHTHMASALAITALEYAQAGATVEQIEPYYAATIAHCDHGRWTVDRRPATWSAYFGVCALDAALKLHARETP